MRFHPLPRGAVRWVAVATAILLGGLIWGTFEYPETLWAPGDLSRFHADIADCSDCHQAFRGAAAGTCIACHSENRFAVRSRPAVSDIHRAFVRAGKPCTDCHTEHRGAMAQITVGAMTNPHGEFVFRATGTDSCGDCHDFSADFPSRAKLLDNAVVGDLMKKGKGAHRPGGMANCLACHRGGRPDVEEKGDR
ncbi:cytochrome c3 family protein [Methylocaldum sp. MU1018]